MDNEFIISINISEERKEEIKMLDKAHLMNHFELNKIEFIKRLPVDERDLACATFKIISRYEAEFGTDLINFTPEQMKYMIDNEQCISTAFVKVCIKNYIKSKCGGEEYK